MINNVLSGMGKLVQHSRYKIFLRWCSININVIAFAIDQIRIESNFMRNLCVLQSLVN